MNNINLCQYNVVDVASHTSYNPLFFDENMPSTMRGKHILVLGASGRLGSQVVRQALDASYYVTTLVRNDRALPFTRQQLRNPNLVICVGSIFSRTNLDRVIEGQDVVINCLGPRRSCEFNLLNFLGQRTSDIDLNSRAQRYINESMARLGVKRLIIVRCHGTSTLDSFFTRLFFSKMHNNDKKVQEKLIVENSKFLDWTIVRVGGLSNGKLTKKYSLHDNDQIILKKVSRADVAHFILKEVGNGTWIQRTPSIDATIFPTNGKKWYY
ncbi:3363_t:CDS:2 [Ambispora gerdemannii]|uniref:3363_t:CDS:1 n=1 Tax=Ambispora gerdemannii TaxID=144530 RepID=A0A9N9B5R9_9GLOM|nr:3363_t:CDS:2 [Ambispora gerdemannii]